MDASSTKDNKTIILRGIAKAIREDLQEKIKGIYFEISSGPSYFYCASKASIYIHKRTNSYIRFDIMLQLKGSAIRVIMYPRTSVNIYNLLESKLITEFASSELRICYLSDPDLISKLTNYILKFNAIWETYNV
jgi:hypothetical protein